MHHTGWGLQGLTCRVGLESGGVDGADYDGCSSSSIDSDVQSFVGPAMSSAPYPIEYWSALTYRPPASPVELALKVLGERLDSIVQTKVLTPRASAEARPNSLSSRYGLREHPPHTDGAHSFRPPRYLIFWMDAIDATHTPTQLRKFDLSALEPTFREQFQRSIWLVRIRSGHYVYVKPISENGLHIAWDPGCFQKDVTGALRKEVVEEHLSKLASEDFHWEAGRVLVVNNRRTLHSRARVQRPEKYSLRYLNRALVP